MGDQQRHNLRRAAAMPTAAISQFFVLSPRGDSIINQNFRHDIPSNSPEVFYRKAKFWKGDVPPIFQNDGLHFLNMKRNGLWFVCVTKKNISPAYGMELLNRVCQVIKDYIGVLNEEGIRKNFILIIELLGEVVDYGYVQGTSSELLKAYVFSEPVMVEAPSKGIANLKLPDTKTISSMAAQNSIMAGTQDRSSK